MLVKVADIPWSKRMAKGFDPPVVRPLEVREAKIRETKRTPAFPAHQGPQSGQDKTA